MTFQETLTAAIADLTEHGYDNAERVALWMERLSVAARQASLSDVRVNEMLTRSFGATFTRLVTNGGIVKYHPGVTRFTIAKLAPEMRAELQRRVMMSANLIKLNRDDMIATTLRRFSGWASSIPIGGSDVVDKREVKKDIGKSLKSLPFQTRRVMIDQGHKFKASLNEIVAKDNGALAIIWHSHADQPGYDGRPEHNERNGKCYAIRGNWAIEKGLMKVGKNGYYDEITAVGEEVYCRCYAQWIYSLNKLPDDMRTTLRKE